MDWRGMGKMVSVSIVVFLLISACSLGKKPQPTPQPTPVPEVVPQRLTSGDFQKALDTCLTACQTHPKSPEIARDCFRTIEAIKAEGDRAFDKEEFSRARSTYELLLKNFPGFSGFAELLSFERSYLITRLKMSRTFVAEKQVQSALKTGQTQKAIDVYRELHQHYPQDAAVRTGFVRILESIKRATRILPLNGMTSFWPGSFLQASSETLSLIQPGRAPPHIRQRTTEGKDEALPEYSLRKRTGVLPFRGFGSGRSDLEEDSLV